MNAARMIALLALIAAVVVAWVLLMVWVDRRIRPAMLRWLWRRLGGTGEPPF